MKRRLAVLLAAVMLLGTVAGAAPAQGGEVETERSRSSVLNVFWHSKRKVAKGTLRTTWYVGIYTSGDEIWSDLYQSVYKCRRVDGRRRCSRVLSRYGDITDLGEGSFTLSNDLSEGHLEATYELSTRTADRRIPGTTTWWISADFEGIGEVSRNAYSDSYTSGCTTWRFRSRGVSRDGEATGTLVKPSGESKDLGETYSAWAYSAKRFSFFRTCEDYEVFEG